MMTESDSTFATTVTPIGQAPIDDVQPAEARATDKLVTFAREHPGLLVAGGLVLGAVAAAVLRGRSGKSGVTASFAQRAATLAAAAGELGLTLSRQARDTAEHVARDGRELARDGRERLSHDSAAVFQHAARLAQEARGTGRKLADEAKRIASRH